MPPGNSVTCRLAFDSRFEIKENMRWGKLLNFVNY